MPLTEQHEFFIQLHLTERCNLRCSHCYQSGKYPAEMSLDDIRNLILEFREMLGAWSDNYGIEFAPSFNVTGGEPVLRKDFFRILEEIGGYGFDMYVLSNGTLIDKDRAVMLSRIGVKGVQVSVEGPEEIHDRIRGDGSFSASMKGARNLLDAGVNVSFNVTLSEVNADYFPEMIALSSEVGVHKLGFSRLVPCGAGAGMINKMVKKERLKEIYSSILSLKSSGLEIVTGDPVASQPSADGGTDAGSVPAAGCAAGLSGLTILPDGTITPCRRLFIPIGNVKKDSLREIWATSEVLGMLRDRTKYKGKCGLCGRWALCRGCRAIAYAYSRFHGGNDFLAEDPQCFIVE